jgi:hypothetical protein
MSTAQIKSLYIQPGSPRGTAYIESFHDKFRDECLNRELFPTLAEARVIIASGRREYNQMRPHSALGYLTPDEFGPAQSDSHNVLRQPKWVAENRGHTLGFDSPRPQCATYPQSPFSGPARCCDVTDPPRRTF